VAGENRLEIKIIDDAAQRPQAAPVPVQSAAPRPAASIQPSGLGGITPMPNVAAQAPRTTPGALNPAPSVQVAAQPPRPLPTGPAALAASPTTPSPGAAPTPSAASQGRPTMHAPGAAPTPSAASQGRPTMHAPGAAPPPSNADRSIREYETAAANQGGLINRLFRMSREAWTRNMRELKDRLDAEMEMARQGATHQQELRRMTAEAGKSRSDLHNQQLAQARQGMASSAMFSPKAALTTATVATIAQTITDAFAVHFRRMAKDTEATAARLSGDHFGAEIAQKEKSVLTKEAVGGGTGMAAGAYMGLKAGARFGPWGALIGTAIGAAAFSEVGKSIGRLVGLGEQDDIAQLTQFRSNMQRFRGRTEELSPYDPRLAQATAQANVAKQLRDIDEARIVSSRYSALSEQQRDIDLLTQQIDLLKSLKEADTQRAVADEQKIKLQQELNKEMAGVSKTIADAVRAMGKGESPMDELLRIGIELPPGAAADPRDHLFNRHQNSKLNTPLLGDSGFGGG
jgi:hypothetical protein